MLILPQKFKAQPRYPAPVHPAWPGKGLAGAFVFDSNGHLVDRVSGIRYAVTGASVRADRLGKVLYFDGSGDYVNLRAPGVAGIGLFADSASSWSVVIRARLESG